MRNTRKSKGVTEYTGRILCLLLALVLTAVISVSWAGTAGRTEPAADEGSADTAEPAADEGSADVAEPAAGETSVNPADLESTAGDAEAIDSLQISLETRTHLVTVPAVLTMDVVISGGSGQYSYRWSCQYADDEEPIEDTTEPEKSSPHKELYVSTPGALVVSVTVTDLETSEEQTVSTDIISAIDRSRWRWDASGEQEAADAYYSRLTQLLEDECNPMEDEVFTDMLQRRYKEQNFTDRQIAEILEVLQNAEALYRDLYLLSFYEYTMFGMQGTGSGYTDPPNAAFVSAASNPQTFTETYFHEAGHGIHMSRWNLAEHPIHAIKTTEGWRSAAEPAGQADLEEKVLEAITQDIRNSIFQHLELLDTDGLDEAQKNQIADALINADPEITEPVGWWTEQVHDSVKDDPVLRRYYQAVRDELSKEISQIPYSNSNMVGDIYGGMTNNKLRLPYGHSGDYWYTQSKEPNGMQICESWAEFFSAMIRGDSYYRRKNEEYFPTAVQALEDLAAALREEYLKQKE